jgi:hypothetical protein
LTHGLNRDWYLSARNLQNVEVRPFGDESPFDVLRAEVILIERGAIDEISAESASDEADAEEAVEETTTAEASGEDSTDEDEADA